MTETWLPVTGYAGIYEVSDLGNVRSVGHSIRNRAVGNLKTFAGSKTSPYLRVNLHKDGKRRAVTVHKLVAEAFLSPCPEGLIVLHGPRGRLDNSASNLSYGTESQNQADRLRDGTDSNGVKHPFAKLTDEQVEEVQALWDSEADIRPRRGPRHPDQKYTTGSLGEMFGVSRSVIHKVVNHKSYVLAV